MLLHVDDDLIDVYFADDVGRRLLLNGLQVRIDACILRSVVFLWHPFRYGDLTLRVSFAHLAYFGHLFERWDLEGLPDLVQFDLASLDGHLGIVVHFSAIMLCLRQIELCMRLWALARVHFATRRWLLALVVCRLAWARGKRILLGKNDLHVLAYEGRPRMSLVDHVLVCCVCVRIVVLDRVCTECTFIPRFYD